MADLQVSIALLLENQAEIASKLAAEGGKAGDAFRNSLTPAAQKAFDELVRSAEKAAKEVGVRFNSTKLQFETARGELIPSSVLDKLSKINAGFAEARNGVEVFKSAISSASKESASNLNLLEAAVTGVAVSLTSKLTDAVTGGLGAIKNMIGDFMQLDTELRSAAAAAGETGAYERLSAVVDKVGIDAAGTQKQVAELATSLVKAGFSVSEVETALPGVVKGAEATGTSFERFGEIVGSTLRQFGLEAKEIGRVNDVYVQTANQTNASTEGIAYAMNEAAPVAKALGVSLEDTAAAIGIMANAGLQGSVAGTGFKTMLLKLQQAAGGASPAVLGLAQGQERLGKIMQMMGGDILDATGKLKPMDQVFLKLKATMDTLSQGDRAALATALFGEDAGPKFLAIINQSAQSIQGVVDKVRNSKGSVDAAREATNGFDRQLKQLTGTIESLGTGVGSVAASGIAPFLAIANQVVGAIAGLPAPIKAAGAAIAIIGTTAVSAAVGIAGLNSAVGMVGGWSKMAQGMQGVLALMGRFAGNAVIFAGVATAVAVLTGNLSQTDAKTKALAQTVVAAAAGFAAWKYAVVVLDLIANRTKLAGAMTLAYVAAGRGIAVLTTAYRALVLVKDMIINRSKIQLSLESLIAGLKTGGIAGAIGGVAIAGIAAGAAYKLIGSQIKVAGEETDTLSEKAKSLKDEIAQLDERIASGKKLKIDTTDLEKLRAGSMFELQKVEQPLEVKLNIEKADAQIKSLIEQRDKLSEGSSGRPVLDAQIAALKEYKQAQEAIDKGSGSKAFEGLSAASQTAVQEIRRIKDEMDKIRAKQIKLDPVKDKAEWDRLEQDYGSYVEKLSSKQVRLKLQLELDANNAKLEQLKAKLAELQKPIQGRSFIESPSDFAEREAKRKEQIRNTTQAIFDLNAKNKEIQNQMTGAAEAAAAADGKRVQTAQEVFDIKKKEFDAETSLLDVQKKQSENADKITETDKKRLGAVAQLVDAYMSLARAQGDLAQSEFDVQKGRNAGAINGVQDEINAIKEAGQERIQAMRDAGASQEQIAAAERENADQIKSKEQEIKSLKEEGKRIEQEAMAAAIEAAGRRFEIERKALELKQKMEILDQQSAIRAAERNVIADRRQLVDLKTKIADPKTTEEERKALQSLLPEQEESLRLSREQVIAEKERLDIIKQTQPLFQDELAAKQQAEANRFRASAAEKRYEGNLSSQLSGLDEQAGKIGNSKMAWSDVASQVDNVLGKINAQNVAIDKGSSKVDGLAAGLQTYQGKGASSGLEGVYKVLAAEEKAYIEAAQKILANRRNGNKNNSQEMEGWRQEEIAKLKEWKKEMEKEGFVEIKPNTWLKRSPDADLIDIQKVDYSRAAMETLKQSANEVADGLKGIGSAAQDAMNNTGELGKSIKPQVDLSEASNDLAVFSRNQGDYSSPTITPQVNTEEASNDLGVFRRQEAEKPLELPIKAPDATKPDQASTVSGGKDKGFVITPTVDTTMADRAFNDLRLQQEGDPFKINLDPSNLQSGTLNGIRGSVQDFIDQLKVTSPDQTINFNASGLDQIKNDLFNTNQQIDAFKGNGQTAGNDLSASFANASGTLQPFADQIRGVSQELQNLSQSGTDPFAGSEESLNTVSFGIDGISSKLADAAINAQALDDALPDPSAADQVAQAYNSMQPPDVSQAVGEQEQLSSGTADTVSTTEDLAASWSNVAAQIREAAAAQAAFQSPSAPARFAGGGVEGGSDYTVNELGREAFLSATGKLSLIYAPQYGKWTAPSRGMVLPASLTTRLQSAGAFESSGGRGPRTIATVINSPAQSRSGEVAAMARLERSINRLEKTMGSYEPPKVNVNLPGNAGLLHTLQAIR